MWEAVHTLLTYNAHLLSDNGNILWFGDDTLTSDYHGQSLLTMILGATQKPNRVYCLFLNVHSAAKIPGIQLSIHALLEQIENLCVILSTRSDRFSKPYTGVLDLFQLRPRAQSQLRLWLMIGNSAGRVGTNGVRDVSDRDRAFAHNAGMKFRTTDSLLTSPPRQVWYWRDMLRLNERREYYTQTKRLAAEHNKPAELLQKLRTTQVLVLFGPPCSGKSAYAKTILSGQSRAGDQGRAGDQVSLCDCNHIKESVMLSLSQAPALPALFVLDSKRVLARILANLSVVVPQIILVDWSVPEKMCMLLRHVQIEAGHDGGGGESSGGAGVVTAQQQARRIQQFFRAETAFDASLRGKVQVVKQFFDADIDYPALWYHFSDA